MSFPGKALAGLVLLCEKICVPRQEVNARKGKTSIFAVIMQNQDHESFYSDCFSGMVRRMKAFITVRGRTDAAGAHCPPFSDRNYRALSSGLFAAETPPEEFADIEIPPAGATLAQCLYLSGLVSPPALCSGMGRCGLCRVRFLSKAPPPLDAEKEILSHHDLDAGWRLACRRKPTPETRVLIPAPFVANSSRNTARLEKRDARAGLAVDLGTTSIYWQIIDVDGRERELPSGVAINPQMGAGSDVVSRLAYAAHKENAANLRRLVLADLSQAAQSAAAFPNEACVAANSAMTALLLGLNASGLAAAPYRLDYAGNAVEEIPGMPPTYIPPLVSPFIGGDVSAGYASLALDPTKSVPEFPFLLADLGTNGECVLALSPTEALAASVPMGPALEGINLACGCQAAPGAITEYALTPHGLEPVALGGTAPVGITATGYLSLLRALRAADVMDEDGRFARPNNAAPLAQKAGGDGRDVERERRLRLPGKMFLTASDVEEILKVKAAFTVAVASLLREAGLSPAALRGVVLSGALGSRAPVRALSDLGFLPPGARIAEITRAAGNTALAGAALFLRRRQTRDACAAWAANATTLDLASRPGFGDAFAEHMVFAWRA